MINSILSFCERNNLNGDKVVLWLLQLPMTYLIPIIGGYLTHKILTFLSSRLSLQFALILISLEIGIILGIATLYFFSIFKNHKLKKQINSLNQQIETLTTHTPDDKFFAEDAGVYVNRTKKILECPRCFNPIKIYCDVSLSDSRTTPYFVCTNGDYQHRPRNRAGTYLDAYTIRDELLNKI